MTSRALRRRRGDTEGGGRPRIGSWFTSRSRSRPSTASCRPARAGSPTCATPSGGYADDRGAVCVALDDFENEHLGVQYGVNPFVLGAGSRCPCTTGKAIRRKPSLRHAVLVAEGEERPCAPGTSSIAHRRRSTMPSVGAGLFVLRSARAHTTSSAPSTSAKARRERRSETMDGGAAAPSRPASRPPPRRLAARVGLGR